MKNKILTISIIFILISFLFINICFASEVYPDPSTVLDSNYSHYGYIVCQRDGDTTYLILIQGNSQEAVNGLTVTTASNIYTGYYYSNVDSVSWSRYTLRNDSWSHDSTRIIADNEGYSGTLSQQLIIASTYDIINHNTGDIFFQAPPVVETITLAGIMNKAGEQATAEMGQIILIVIMTTAGLTVLLIGLKKGLTVLMSGFRH